MYFKMCAYMIYSFKVILTALAKPERRRMKVS